MITATTTSHQVKEPAFLDNFADRQDLRARARELLAVIYLREKEEENNYEVRYLRDPEDRTLWKRTRIRKFTAKEKKQNIDNPKRELL
jgi:hypothetical protein